ncbi:MAG: FAD-binding protein [Gammaproteobacteria bacterium]|nr:FAD-binding protein [Gammaproteobacteria bacterium]MCI0591252.1 FAD-binding protein [Gammaproteobacteria bacterium]
MRIISSKKMVHSETHREVVERNRRWSDYLRKRQIVSEALEKNTEQIRLSKRTTSNLFRYKNRQHQATRAIPLKDFDHVIALDQGRQTLNVEGLATYESIANYCLARGFLPTVTPELKHITIGGAICGIGIESTCHRYGFVHDGLIEADLLLPSGEVVTCRADNEYADLFYALANSYGTLGYILRTVIQLCPVKPYVHVRNIRYSNINSYVDAMEDATVEGTDDYIEGLFFSDRELYLTVSSQVDDPPYVDDIYGKNTYYKTLRTREEMYLKTKDYIFRYDPDWFWNIPDTALFNLFRQLAPKSLRNSGAYNRYVQFKQKLMKLLRVRPDNTEEQLIQDWEVPWDRGKEFVRFLLGAVDIQGQPWVALPIRTLKSPTLYPLKAGALYLNIGCYCFAKRPDADEDYHYTKLLDKKCFELGGLKMLYSSTFLDEADFDRIYNGQSYRALKQKYDPDDNAPTLFEKTVKAR